MNKNKYRMENIFHAGETIEDTKKKKGKVRISHKNKLVS